jgi:hypothetical protein
LGVKNHLQRVNGHADLVESGIKHQ